MSSELAFQHECVICDACSVINLYATDRMGDILRAAPTRFAVCSHVKDKEALGVFNGQVIDGKRQRNPINLEPLITAGILDVAAHDWNIHANQIIVLSRAGISGMGEKISSAIALEKGWGIVTDDRHAHKKLTVLMPQTQILTTIDLVRHWANVENIGVDVLREVLEKIRIRGNAEPAQDHPHYAWIMSIVSTP
ncbi:MAG: hypothetical protein HS103_07925 [Anaerolineales bacterium]|nr:hypothetical protein [Anaerolineales bacterium]